MRQQHRLVDRRAFLKAGVSLSGGLVIAIALPGCSGKPTATPALALKTITSNAWLRIGTDDRITFLCDRSEMGQGVYTALPMLLAEELGVALTKIEVQFAPADPAYINNLIGIQVTGGSSSVRDAWQKLRTAGAQAREMLIAAACQQWQEPTAGCRVENGTIISSHGNRLNFGAVAEAAAALPVPKNVKLKARDKFTLLGTERLRLDTPLKVDGSAQYGIDVRLEGMLYGALAQAPVLGGKVKSVDDAAAKTMPGVQAVLNTSTGVVVVANSWWQARKARDALKITWDAGPNAALNNATIMAGLRKAAASPGRSARQDGDVAAQLAAAPKNQSKVLRADYELPLLAHATLEPQNCTAHVTADGCDLYVPTQTQIVAQATAAQAAGLKPEQVRVHTTFLGGGFGRRLEVDFIPAAVEASKAVGKPVKVLWTREDDMTHDAYRPPAFDQATAVLDASGKLTAWKLHLVGPSITARLFPAAVEKDIDPFAIEAAANFPYNVKNVEVDYLRHEIGINVGYLRSVSHALNCFVAESFMDEIAGAAGADPLQFRQELLVGKPRFLGVLRTLSADAHYAQQQSGHFHGIATMEGYGTYMAMLADVSIAGGKAEIHRLHCVIDCGQMVNPSIVRAQCESAMIFGLTATLWGDVTIAGGRVQQSNFDRYRLARITDIPQISCTLIDNGEPPGGVGEPATALVAPAVCNALFRATGKRLRSLPLARHGFA